MVYICRKGDKSVLVLIVIYLKMESGGVPSQINCLMNSDFDIIQTLGGG